MTGRPPMYDLNRDVLMRLREAGLGRIRIAKIFHCQDTTVRAALVKHGLPTGRPANAGHSWNAELNELVRREQALRRAAE